MNKPETTEEIKKRERQDRILAVVGWIGAIVFIGLIAFGAAKNNHDFRQMIEDINEMGVEEVIHE